MNRIIFSCQQSFFKYAADELKRIDASMRIIERLDNETCLCECSLPFEEISGALREAVFIRHICPVQIEAAPLAVQIISSVLYNFHIEPNVSFAVQTRILDNGSLKAYDINRELSSRYVAAGCLLDVKSPKKIISIVIKDKAYLGLSESEQNLSDWAGGRILFHKGEEQISRAEFKLEEAMHCMNISIQPQSRVLDLGAAPGGWSRIALMHGAWVTAVDPAELDKRLNNYPRLEHIKDTAQNFIKHSTQDFDLLLNDMRMDAEESAALTNLCAPMLRPGGLALITLKLTGVQPLRQINEAKRILSESYQPIRARQLFHNRSEITVLLRRSTD